MFEFNYGDIKNKCDTGIVKFENNFLMVPYREKIYQYDYKYLPLKFTEHQLLRLMSKEEISLIDEISCSDILLQWLGLSNFKGYFDTFEEYKKQLFYDIYFVDIDKLDDNISKNKIKLVRALETKKGREKQGLFVAEGPKVVGDLLAARFELVELFEEEEDIKKVSFLQHPQGKLGIFKLPEQTKTKVGECETAVGAERKMLLGENELALALDGVQDPGNLGTIIRVADWFGIERIFCSMDTADCWNPKVVQATMGSIARVKMYYLNLNELINLLPTDYPIYGTLLDGEDIYEEKLSANGLIVMGNEGNGISAAIRQRVNRKLLIPNFSVGTTRAESLNVAIATAVVCSEFKRREQRKV